MKEELIELFSEDTISLLESCNYVGGLNSDLPNTDIERTLCYQFVCGCQDNCLCYPQDKMCR